MTPPTDFTLRAERLAAAFPMHVVLDRRLRVVAVGEPLARCCPALTPDAEPGRALRLEQPALDWTWGSLLAHRERPLLLRTPRGLALRTLCVSDDDAGLCMLLCEPLVSHVRELTEHGLSPADFAPFSTAPELLQLVQVHLGALAEAKRQADQVSVQLVELRAAVDREASARRSRLDFLSAFLHQVQSAVSGDLGLLRHLGDTELDPDQSDSVATLVRSSHALLSVLRDVDDYTSLQFADFSSEVGPYDLHALFRDSVEQMRPDASDKGLSLALEIASDVPRYASGPARRVHQVLQQMLGNAIKYTAKGGVTVRLRLASFYEVGFAFRAEVQDTGPGIQREQQSKLFQEFSRIESSVANGTAGPGLGLAICQRILRLMEGLNGVDSVPGKGSTFWFTVHQGLPSADDLRRLAEQGVAVEFPAPAVPLAAPRVLLAEDSTVNQKAAVRVLERLGCTCDVAADGREALELFFERPYDLVLMDCMMPEMDGFEAARAMRERAPADRPRVPIVALTASSAPEDRARASAAGMDGFVTKPVRLEVLQKALSHFFGRKLDVAA